MEQPVLVRMTELQAIRNQSWELVALHNLPTHPDLPLIDPPSHMQTQEKVVERSLILSILLTCIYGYDKRKALKWMEKEELADKLEKVEMDFMQNRLDLESRSFIYNQVEGLWALVWALSLEPHLSYLSYCSNRLANHFPELNDAGSKAQLLAKVALRAERELVEACDFAYCLHWSYIEMKVNAEENPMPIDEFAVVERRRALEWILYGQQWYEVDLST